mmetsp:Transcript_47148/g.131610  ORF Transcript_47148/g.131610 Transcript_47148/m.131610 type:complete len:312 (+) Transcript_47148:243-1178(+)
MVGVPVGLLDLIRLDDRGTHRMARDLSPQLLEGARRKLGGGHGNHVFRGERPRDNSGTEHFVPDSCEVCLQHSRVFSIPRIGCAPVTTEERALNSCGCELGWRDATGNRAEKRLVNDVRHLRANVGRRRTCKRQLRLRMNSSSVWPLAAARALRDALPNELVAGPIAFPLLGRFWSRFDEAFPAAQCRRNRSLLFDGRVHLRRHSPGAAIHGQCGLQVAKLGSQFHMRRCSIGDLGVAGLGTNLDGLGAHLHAEFAPFRGTLRSFDRHGGVGRLLGLGASLLVAFAPFHGTHRGLDRHGGVGHLTLRGPAT